MARLTLNHGAIDDLLYGASGPVYKQVRVFGKKVEELAKVNAPRETGALKSSIDSDEPSRQAGFLLMRVGAPVLADDRGRVVDYAWIVHQGHARIQPKNQGDNLLFYWRKRGRYFVGRALTDGRPGQSVAAQPRKPYLQDAMVEANALTGGEFRITFESVQVIPH